jgi:hypothetical protein
MVLRFSIIPAVHSYNLFFNKIILSVPINQTGCVGWFWFSNIYYRGSDFGSNFYFTQKWNLSNPVLGPIVGPVLQCSSSQNKF